MGQETRAQQRDVRRPRLGFLGLGWIGRNRLQAVAESEPGEIAALCDPSAEAVSAAHELAPRANVVSGFEDLIAEDLDGIVIATPSALHARQAVEALERGLAVFVQNPLARTPAEATQIVAAAKRHGLPLAVDFSYRHVRGVSEMRELVRNGELGQVFAADLVFHNAYGPDKAWFYNPELSGGGCVIDLGVHLVDLAQWMLGFPSVDGVQSRLISEGLPLADSGVRVEDFATASWDCDTGAHVRLACSWRLSAGRDAVIEASFYGTRGAVSLRNVNGSFYDFTVERWTGTKREMLAEPPDAWSGRAIVNWVRRMAAGEGFDPECERLVDVAELIDRIYAR